MPLYEYRCNQCGHRFEKIQSFSAEPLTECPKCQGELYRPLSAPALQIQGLRLVRERLRGQTGLILIEQRKHLPHPRPPHCNAPRCPALRHNRHLPGHWLR